MSFKEYFSLFIGYTENSKPELQKLPLTKFNHKPL